MKTSDFYFDLPKELIAQRPLEERTESRLLCLEGDSGELHHRGFQQILDLIEPGDLLVMNDTRVIPARLFGKKESGGQLEILIERILDTQTVLAHVRSSRSPKPGSFIYIEDGKGSEYKVEMVARQEALFELKFLTDQPVLEILEEVGHMPLPPYMEREDDTSDRERYQTVYSDKDKAGAVAAPTAGLHFDENLLAQLKDKGVDLAFVTLHVGAGTFQPVKVDNVDEHKMHSEYIEVPQNVVDAVKATKKAGKRIIAVGTTSVRSLESASHSGQIDTFAGDSDIFIYPGYKFKTVDAMITNFHLPESTLIMLVSAFAGKDHVMHAYEQAVKEKYRFFSYGDAMFVTKKH